MPFVPSSEEDRQLMLERIGASSFEDLIAGIPKEVRYKMGDMDFPRQLSEYEIKRLLSSYAGKNKSASGNLCFLGGGAYDRFIPSIVPATIDRPEFRTAYTPYQAEVSQGTLQVMYEYQSMICELYGMEVSNASLYDGGTSLAEACLMSNSVNKNSEFIFLGTVHPNYKHVTKTITQGKNFKFKELKLDDGTADIEKLKETLNDNTSAVIVQQPNFLGTVEQVREIEKIVRESKALFIVVADPVSVSLLEAPGNYDADVVVGEGQSLGLPMSYGGPYLGIFACKRKYVRKIPGRITGITKDEDGKRGFVLTLQTREQQIKREKATSNICTNQGLFMLAATVYMETMGKQGLKEVADQSYHKAQYLADKIQKLDGFSLINDKPFLFEFGVKTPVPASEIIEKAANANILAGLDISKYIENQDGLLIAVTETRTKEELDKFVDFLSNF